MTSHPHLCPDPLSLRGLVAGVAAGALAWMAAAFLDSNHTADPIAGFIVLFTPVIVSIATGVYALVGWPVYAALRRAGPAREPARFLFVALVAAPLVFAECLVVTICIDALTGYSGPADGGGSLPARLCEAVEHYGQAMLSMAACGGLACWCADRAPLLWSAERGRRRRARVTASILVALAAAPPLAFLLGEQYVVLYRAQAIAGARPYCLLVPSYDGRLYETATKRWQLSSWQMQAGTVQVSGSRGSLYDTNHALLVLDEPRQYLNWSYGLEDFEHDALIDGSVRNTEPRSFKPCEPKRDFAAGLR